MFVMFIIIISLFCQSFSNIEEIVSCGFIKNQEVRALDKFSGNPENSPKKRKTICLNMIVKNESKVIKRCLGSLKHLIDYWVIVDTGSTDATKKIIKEYMQDIPGELHEREWKNFEVNRNQALELARNKADFLFFIDADEELIFDENFIMPALDCDAYYVTCGYKGMEFLRVGLINNKLNWKYEGVLHEAIYSDQVKSFKKLEGVYNLTRREGCRSQDANSSLKDIEVFKNILEKTPDDSRSVFYLANTYLQINDYKHALQFYEKRASMTKSDEEVFLSRLTIAQLHQTMNKPLNLVVEHYYKAYTSRPNRSEPLYFLAKYYRINNMFHEGFSLANFGMKIPFPNEKLIIEKWIYDYGLYFELAMCALELERYVDAYLAFLRILSQNVKHEYILNETKKHIETLERKIMAGEIPNMEARVNYGT